MKIIILSALLMFAFQSDRRGPDGHFHDPNTGAVQPDHCDNGFDNPHPCTCQRASEANCDSEPGYPGKMCKTYCRTNDCHCVNTCS